MKSIVRKCEYGYCVMLDIEALKTAGIKPGDSVTVDIPMTGGGLVIHKATLQRTGEEVV